MHPAPTFRLCAGALTGRLLLAGCEPKTITTPKTSTTTPAPAIGRDCLLSYF